MSKSNGKNGKGGSNGKIPLNGRGGRGYTPHEQAARKKRFIEGLSEFGTVKHGAESAEICTWTAYDWRGKDAEFAEAWQGALKDAQNELEKSMYQRAMNDADTTAAIFMLKAMDPSKYRERFDINQKTEGSLDLRVAGMTQEQAQQMVTNRLEQFGEG